MKNSEMEKIWTKLLKNIDYVRPNKSANLNPSDVIVREILIPSTFTEVQQVGIDVTLNCRYDDSILISSHNWKRVICNEVVCIPNDVFGIIYIRSSLSDKGILLSAGVYDPGYKYIISFVLHNDNDYDFILLKNERIAQIIFYHADSYCSYNGHNQGKLE